MRRDILLVVVVVACSSREQAPAPSPSKQTRDDAPRIDAAPNDAHVPPPADPQWRTRYDFDGDGVSDVIKDAYSGGAHCCYMLRVELSKSRRAVAIPFELDGGYVGGLDLSQPQSFDIQVGSDRVATLRMRIATYGGRLEPIPLAWVRAYGARSHIVIVDVRDGTVKVENVPWDCATALRRIEQRNFTGWEGLPACDRVALADHLEGMQRQTFVSRTQGTEKHEVAIVADAVQVGDGYAIEFAVRDQDRVVRADTDDVRPVASFVDELGPPDAQIPYSLWGFVHPTGQWVWPARGLVVYVDPANKTVHHIGVFTPTDLATYRRELAR